MTVPKITRALWVMLLTVPVAACGGFFHSNARPEQVYFLRAAAAPSSARVGASLRFNRPTANPGLDSPQIVLVQSDHRMSFYLASRWAGPTSSLIETLAVEKLRASGSWQSVADSTSSFPSDYVVQTVVRRFEADYTEGSAAPVVHVVLDCIVGKREGREVIASFLAQSSAPASDNKMSAVVAAFEAATNAALDSLTTQTADAVGKALATKRD